MAQSRESRDIGIDFGFVYLVKPDRKAWSELQISLMHLKRNILDRLSVIYRVIIFIEEDPPRDMAAYLKQFDSAIQGRLNIESINLAEFVRRPTHVSELEFPSASRCDQVVGIGYRDMCKFFAFDVFQHGLVGKCKYMVRLDTDSFFMNASKSFARDLEHLVEDYAYLRGTVQAEDKAVSVGFGRHLYMFKRQEGLENRMSESWQRICGEATASPLIYYTNFEVVRVQWALSYDVKKLADHVVDSNGIYRYRWGDALIRYYFVKLLNARRKELKGVLYKHSGMYDSRNVIRMTISKIYLKATGQEHCNRLEFGHKWIDRILVGLRK